MRVWILIFTGAISIGIQCGPLRGQSKNQPDEVKNPSRAKPESPKAEQRGTKNAPFFVHIEQSDKEGNYATKTQENDAKTGYWDIVSAKSAFWTAIFNGLLVAVGGGGVCAALKTLRVMGAQFDQWVVLSNWRIQQEGFNRLRIKVDLINPSQFPMTVTAGTSSVLMTKMEDMHSIDLERILFSRLRLRMKLISFLTFLLHRARQPW